MAKTLYNKSRCLSFIGCACLVMTSSILADDSPDQTVRLRHLSDDVDVDAVERVRFDLDGLFKAPEVFHAPELQVDGVKSFFYRGLTYKGQPTRIFAHYGLPEKRDGESDAKHPAMVLIHGGGGTAFDRWVKVWNARGYAAIAMDLCGCVPVGTYGNWKRHELGGPMGWDASFDQLNDPIEDQLGTTTCDDRPSELPYYRLDSRRSSRLLSESV